MKGVDIAKCGQILQLRTHVAGRVESRFFATMGMPGSAMRRPQRPRYVHLARPQCGDETRSWTMTYPIEISVDHVARV